MVLQTFVLSGKKQLVHLWCHCTATENIPQITASIKSKIHVTELTSALMSSVDGFKPDGPFLIHVAVLVRDF